MLKSHRVGVFMALAGRLAGTMTILSPVQSIIAKGFVRSATHEPMRGPRRGVAGAVGTLKGLGTTDELAWLQMSNEDNKG